MLTEVLKTVMNSGDTRLVLIGNSGNQALPLPTVTPPDGLAVTDVSPANSAGYAYELSSSKDIYGSLSFIIDDTVAASISISASDLVDPPIVSPLEPFEQGQVWKTRILTKTPDQIVGVSGIDPSTQNIILWLGYQNQLNNGNSQNISTQDIAGESSIFVSQNLTTDATLTVRVQDLEPTQADTKAGLMLRQSTELNSPYVYVYINDSGIQIDYTQGGDPNNIAHISGSTATTPVYLRLERKEGSVYVYESDDGINFSLIITIVLSLSNPFSMGLASTTVNSTVTAQFNELQLQVQRELKAEFTASITSGEAPLTVTFDASASTGEGELTYEWWFGNGATATGANVSFTYEDSGEYVAILVVSDGSSESSASQLIVASSDKEPNTIQLPYTINIAEVGDDGQYIVRGLLPTNIKHVDTVPIFNTRQDRITFLRLVDANYHLISQEVVLPNIKESIHFDASNAVSAFALYTLSLNQVPSDDLIAIYPLIEQHPSFSEAVARLRILGGMRLVDIDASDPSILKFIADIGLEVARQYFIDNGTVDPNQLNPLEPEQPNNEHQNDSNTGSAKPQFGTSIQNKYNKQSIATQGADEFIEVEGESTYLLLLSLTLFSN